MQKSQDAMFCLNTAAMFCLHPARQARMAGSAPAGGGPPGKNRRMRCFAYIRKLNVCQRSRSSQPPTVRLPTWIRAVPRIPGVNSDSGSSTVISAS